MNNTIEIPDCLAEKMESFFNKKRSNDGYVDFIKYKTQLEAAANQGDEKAHSELISWGLHPESTPTKTLYKSDFMFFTIWKKVIYG